MKIINPQSFLLSLQQKLYCTILVYQYTKYNIGHSPQENHSLHKESRRFTVGEEISSRPVRRYLLRGFCREIFFLSINQ